MKTLLFSALAALIFAAAPLRGQATVAGAPAPAPAPAAPTEKAPIDALTPAEKQHLEDAHQKALAAYPKLLQEEQRIQGEITAMHNGAKISKEKIMEEFVAHRKQLEVYMVKVDPTVQPLLDKIHAAQAENAAPAGAAPAPAAPPQ